MIVGIKYQQTRSQCREDVFTDTVNSDVEHHVVVGCNKENNKGEEHTNSVKYVSEIKITIVYTEIWNA